MQLLLTSLQSLYSMDNNKFAAIFDEKPNDSGLSLLKSPSIYPFFFLVLPFFNGFYNPSLIQNKLSFWIMDIIDHAVIPIVLLIIFKNNNNWIKSSFKWPKVIEEWVYFFIFIIAAMILGPIFFSPLNEVCHQAFNSNLLFNGVSFNKAFEGVKFSKITLMFYAALSAGIFEEIFYKGIFYKILIDNKHSAIKAYIILSIIFTAMHWEQGVSGILTVFTYSILSFFVYGYLKNLVPLILLHSAIDLYAFYDSIFF